MLSGPFQSNYVLVKYPRFTRPPSPERAYHLFVVYSEPCQTPEVHLAFASMHGYLEIVKFLVESGANIHANNDKALRWAAGAGDGEPRVRGARDDRGFWGVDDRIG